MTHSIEVFRSQFLMSEEPSRNSYFLLFPSVKYGETLEQLVKGGWHFKLRVV